MDESDVGDDLSGILLTEKEIQAKVVELAAAIDADYAGKKLLLVGVLKGAVMVMADLARAVHLPVTVDFMAVSSYGSGSSSSGVVRILKDLDDSIEGRHVLVIEDIVDSGLTLSYLQRGLMARGPASFEICALLLKTGQQRAQVHVAYVGFEIAPEFVVGYGLDYAERYRGLRYIGRLKPSVYGG